MFNTEKLIKKATQYKRGFEPPEDAYVMTRHVEKTPKKPAYVTIDFKAGVPVALNGKKKTFLQIIEALNIRK